MDAWAIVGLILVGGIAVILVWYWHDRRQILAAIAADGQIIETACGPMECAIAGHGPALLTVHGWGGGGSGGYNMFRFLADRGFTILSVSRPGYLGTPLTVGQTMEAQADALVALLDALHFPHAAVLCGSGGGPASLLFALRHPERCWGLMLVSALTSPEPVRDISRLQRTLEIVFESDFLIWLSVKLAWRSLVEEGMGGLNADIRNNAVKMAALRSLVDGLIVCSHSRAGMKNDMQQWRNHMPAFPFAQIAVPTLIIHSRNDKSIPYRFAEQTSAIPNSRLITFEDGGHTCYIVHDEVTQPATLEFLNAHKPA
ncbi:MAG: alpha/beta hydrolase [Anaerolineae bacterium]|nr:alpha/beta hydrolase [Anaerolineae bacterium]